MIRTFFEPLPTLMAPEQTIGKEFFKQAVVEDMHNGLLAGIPQSRLAIEFDPPSGSDILVKRVDQENALGYKVFQGEADYFQALDREMTPPRDADILGAKVG